MPIGPEGRRGHFKVSHTRHYWLILYLHCQSKPSVDPLSKFSHKLPLSFPFNIEIHDFGKITLFNVVALFHDSVKIFILYFYATLHSRVCEKNSPENQPIILYYYLLLFFWYD